MLYYQEDGLDDLINLFNLSSFVRLRAQGGIFSRGSSATLGCLEGGILFRTILTRCFNNWSFTGKIFSVSFTEILIFFAVNI